VLDRLRYWLINWERVARETEVADTPLPRLAGEFQEAVLPELLSLASLARQGGVPRIQWQGLPEQGAAVTRELSPLAGGAPRLSLGRASRCLAALDRIDAGLKGIRACLRGVFRARPLTLARKVLDDRRTDLAAIGAEGRLTLRSAGEPTVFVSPELLERVLDGLVDNALRALEGAPAPELEIAIETEGAHCRIDVCDTGTGIAEESWERVFDRSFTTRSEGGGFGLYYAREALARYEGRIFVLVGGPGRGATFRILLRISEHGLTGPTSAATGGAHA
jgi:hypothetical protein